jgi:tetratricopeptide (TPR) repeat protein
LHPLLFHVYGIGGIGKSTLLDTLAKTYSQQARIVEFDFTGKTLSNETPLKVMNKLYEQIPQPGFLTQDLFKSDPFLRLYAQYQGTLEELTTTPIEGKETVDKDQSDLVKDLGSAAVYGLGAFFLAHVDPINAMSLGVSAIAETTKGTVSGVGAIKDNLLAKHPATKQDKKLQELMLEPVSQLTKAFVEGLIQIQKARLLPLPTSQTKPIILVLDHYEKATSDLNLWLTEYLLKESDLQSQPIRFVVAGRYSLKKKSPRNRDLIFERQLEKFDKIQTEEYLNKIGITEPKIIRQIYQATDGFPFHLDLIRQQKEEGREINCSRDNKELVDRLLEGLTSNQKQVMHLAAYCRWFDEALIQKLVTANCIDKDENSNWFEWLIERELVVEENQFRLHDVVRDILRRSHFKANQQKFRDNHALIAKYFEKLADGEVKPENPAPEKYENSQWREYIAESLYHTLYAERTKGQRLLITHLLAGAYLSQIDVVINPFSAVTSEGEFENNELLPHDTRKFLKDIKLAVELGEFVLNHDPNKYEIKDDHGNSLKSQIEASVKACLSQVDFLDGLGKYAGLIFKFLRSHQANQQVYLLQLATEEAEKITNDIYPEFSSNLFFNVGNMLGNLERHEEALNSFDKALTIKNDFAEALNNQALALLALERNEEALISCDKALTIKSDFARAWYIRGRVLEKLEQYEEAFINCDKALAIKSDFASAWNLQGAILMALHRYQEALNSCDKVLNIQPKNLDTLNIKSLTLS